MNAARYTDDSSQEQQRDLSAPRPTGQQPLPAAPEVEAAVRELEAAAAREDAIGAAVTNLLDMQRKYSFPNDADSVAEAIQQFSNLLNLELTDAEVEIAAARALEAGPEHLRSRA